MNNFEATIAEGIYLVSRGDHAISQRDEFSKTYLTKAGQKIYRSISPASDQATLRRLVTQAVQAGYEEHKIQP